MANVSLLSSPQQVANLLKEMEDPITLTTFDNPVTLNCGHNLSLGSAKDIFGIMQKTLQVERPGGCPICRQRIVSYAPNCALRNLIAQIQEGAATVLPLVAQQMAEQPLPVLPFPGIEAKFVCSLGWKARTNDLDISLIRKMVFNSVVCNSFLNRVIVYGDLNDNVSIVFECNKYRVMSDAFKDYFSKLGLSNVDYLKLSCSVSRPHELNWALHFLMANNKFSDEPETAFLQRLLTEKKWRHVEQEMNMTQPLSSSSSSSSASATPPSLPSPRPHLPQPSASPPPLPKAMARLTITPPVDPHFQERKGILAPRSPKPILPERKATRASQLEG